MAITLPLDEVKSLMDFLSLFIKSEFNKSVYSICLGKTSAEFKEKF